MNEYNTSAFPEEIVEVEELVWEREKHDTDSFQWIREMEVDEYSWDVDEVQLVGTNAPIRVVSMEFHNGEWVIEASETAGPKYHRPGFTELINSNFTTSTQSFEEAAETVMDYTERLS